jgi:hypothetical protein
VHKDIQIEKNGFNPKSLQGSDLEDCEYAPIHNGHIGRWAD